ncbi:Ribosome-binding factor A [Caulifigura coniformis]|uniref:Ribosome-binding factor A n=1 Tax=Caulifigura coniformis TaxID=2527983 RepID=A0A517S8T4_9PLAN|nr:30S ribosome-binding factor RbfA [Caulifigura coniformis]QDT52544.1 Ribosome-binding factor A [Caulifigura coniformis]
MSHRRTAKVAQAIRQVVSTAILTELRDPRVKKVTVLNVEVPPDLRSAKVYVSVMGEEREGFLVLRGLQSARGFLQSRIADEIDLRWTPILEFVLDNGVKKSIETSKMLRDAGVGTEDDEDAPEAAEADGEDVPESEDDSG